MQSIQYYILLLLFWFCASLAFSLSLKNLLIRIVHGTLKPNTTIIPIKPSNKKILATGVAIDIIANKNDTDDVTILVIKVAIKYLEFIFSWTGILSLLINKIIDDTKVPIIELHNVILPNTLTATKPAVVNWGEVYIATNAIEKMIPIIDNPEKIFKQIYKLKYSFFFII